MRKSKGPTRRTSYPITQIGSFDEDEDAVAYAERLRKEFAEMDDGHHAQIRRFLQRAYWAALNFREQPEAFERLKADPFWESSRQKPKDASTSRWVLYFVIQATTKNVRNRAGKYAVVLDGLANERLRSGLVARRIVELGGVEDAYEFMQSRKRQAARARTTTNTLSTRATMHRALTTPTAAALLRRRRRGRSGRPPRAFR